MSRFALLLPALLLAGCIGTRQEIGFAEAAVPLSLSGALLDAGGEPVSGEQLEVVGRLAARQRGWSIFWTVLTLSAIDFSATVNEQVAAVGGAGVINLQIVSEAGCTVSLNQVPLVALLPIYPGCADVALGGDIVRLRPDAPRKGGLRLLR